MGKVLRIHRETYMPLHLFHGSYIVVITKLFYQACKEGTIYKTFPVHVTFLVYSIDSFPDLLLYHKIPAHFLVMPTTLVG